MARSAELHLHVSGLPAFKALLERLTGLHQPTDEEAEYEHGEGEGERPGPCPTPDKYGCSGHTETVQVCRECGYEHDDGYPVFRRWPCPTLLAVRDLTAGDTDGA